MGWGWLKKVVYPVRKVVDAAAAIAPFLPISKKVKYIINKVDDVEDALFDEKEEKK